LFVLVCLILGGVTNAVLQETGFGSLFNALLVMTAFAAAILVRDVFFRAGDNLALEPYLSMGMMLAALKVCGLLQRERDASPKSAGVAVTPARERSRRWRRAPPCRR
jgi:hypothetical protein